MFFEPKNTENNFTKDNRQRKQKKKSIERKTKKKCSHATKVLVILALSSHPFLLSISNFIIYLLNEIEYTYSVFILIINNDIFI